MKMYSDPESFWNDARRRMVDTQLRTRGIRDERLLDAFLRVPRHLFVGRDVQAYAYADEPLPIGASQTISQPYIVAAMLDAVRIRPTDKVLEIGTGSGYQTALLCDLAAMIYSIERHTSLAKSAQSVLEYLGYRNFVVIVGDGTNGYPAAAPYDAIIVSAAAPAIPPSLIGQLADGGRMVIPVGDAVAQELQLVERRGEQIVTRSLDACRFVPLVGREGFHS